MRFLALALVIMSTVFVTEVVGHTSQEPAVLKEHVGVKHLPLATVLQSVILSADAHAP